MTNVVGVHGIAQEQLGRRQLVDVWTRAMADGVEIARGRSAVIPSLDIAFYGEEFLTDGAQGTVTKRSLQLWDDLDDLSSADLQFVQLALDELLPDVGNPSEKGFHEVPLLLQPVLRRLSRRYDMRASLALISALRQVRQYLMDDALADRIRAHVIETIGGRCSTLIGHSLGSVVAWETVALNPGLVDTLMTIGSPLSIRTVTDHLRSTSPLAGSGKLWQMPTGLTRWVNIYDPADPVAIGGGMARIWSSVEDFTVDNGDQPHSVSRYLSKRVSGEVIASAAGN